MFQAKDSATDTYSDWTSIFEITDCYKADPHSALSIYLESAALLAQT